MSTLTSWLADHALKRAKDQRDVVQLADSATEEVGESCRSGSRLLMIRTIGAFEPKGSQLLWYMMADASSTIEVAIRSETVAAFNASHAQSLQAFHNQLFTLDSYHWAIGTPPTDTSAGATNHKVGPRLVLHVLKMSPYGDAAGPRGKIRLSDGADRELKRWIQAVETRALAPALVAPPPPPLPPHPPSPPPSQTEPQPPKKRYRTLEPSPAPQPAKAELPQPAPSVVKRYRLEAQGPPKRMARFRSRKAAPLALEKEGEDIKPVVEQDQGGERVVGQEQEDGAASHSSPKQLSPMAHCHRVESEGPPKRRKKRRSSTSAPPVREKEEEDVKPVVEREGTVVEQETFAEDEDEDEEDETALSPSAAPQACPSSPAHPLSQADTSHLSSLAAPAAGQHPTTSFHASQFPQATPSEVFVSLEVTSQVEGQPVDGQGAMGDRAKEDEGVRELEERREAGGPRVLAEFEGSPEEEAEEIEDSEMRGLVASGSEHGSEDDEDGKDGKSDEDDEDDQDDEEIVDLFGVGERKRPRSRPSHNPSFFSDARRLRLQPRSSPPASPEPHPPPSHISHLANSQPLSSSEPTSSAAEVEAVLTQGHPRGTKRSLDNINVDEEEVPARRETPQAAAAPIGRITSPPPPPHISPRPSTARAEQLDESKDLRPPQPRQRMIAVPRVVRGRKLPPELREKLARWS